MSFRKLGFAALSTAALLMSFHSTPASAHGHHYYRHDDRGWYDDYGNYHRYERCDRWGWYDNDGDYHRYDDRG